jgi:tRNA uridine 5-carbamoylmethylation protein Kti12
MTRIIAIHGLPNSGKTTLANKLSARLSAPIISESSIRTLTANNGKTEEDYNKINKILKATVDTYRTDSDNWVIVDEVGISRNNRGQYTAEVEIFMNTITGDSSDASVQTIFEVPDIELRVLQDLEINSFDYDSDTIVNFITDQYT